MIISKLFLLFQILFSLSIVKSDVFIKEIYIKNKNNLKASYGSSDWIEFYNSGEKPFDLSGYGLSNEDNILFKFTLPEKTLIKSKSFLKIFLSKESSKNKEIYANFKLDKKEINYFFQIKKDH